MPRPARPGLGWIDVGVYPNAYWAREPHLDTITATCRRHLERVDGKKGYCRVSFMCEGLYSLDYRVYTDSGAFLIQVLLPMDPHNMMCSEVATLRWLRARTSIPVPEVLAHDDSSDNAIGFEWSLKTFTPGSELRLRWRKMSMEQKTYVARQFAEICAQLFSCGPVEGYFEGIGSLLSSHGRESCAYHDTNCSPGPLVSPGFFWHKRFYGDVARGAFREAEDDETRRQHEARVEVMCRLGLLLPHIFPSLVSQAERTILRFGNLGMEEIYIDDNCKVVDIRGWQCTWTAPVWMAAEEPYFLTGWDREVAPDRADYAPTEDLSDYVSRDAELDNEGLVDLYWEHAMEYDKTVLRRVYAARLQELWPPWGAVQDEYGLQIDFQSALAHLCAGDHVHCIGRWVAALEKNHVRPLRDFFPDPVVT
ncbi:hypothetical protein GQ53DRAFT_808308 [Thozetella sp. PMI_491]|nr:hypothetical protein GQ53DRAFT_808308 [Thozetella sp. PMI_491]